MTDHPNPTASDNVDLETATELYPKIQNTTARIGIIGLGYVGLPLALHFTEAGFPVAGFDIDKGRVERLKRGDSYIDDVSDAQLKDGLDAGFTPESEPQSTVGCDVYIIAVPTDVNDGHPEMGAIKAASKIIRDSSDAKETLVVVSSTVYPGATTEVVTPLIEEDRDAPTRLAMVPERINPGGEYAFDEIPLVVGADTDAARNAAVALFETVVTDTHPVESTVTAELAKTLENTYRMVNIALVNELITLAEGLDGDVWAAIDAAATKPFGFEPFAPGPGVGGHCIPIDPQFLIWRANELGTDISFVEDAQAVNESMPNLVVNRLETMLQARGVELEEASIVALGAAYKANVGDTRNSPALEIVDRLSERASVHVVDPHADEDETARSLLRDPADAALDTADAVLLLVDHNAFDLEYVGNTAEFVFDTRNAMTEEVTADVVTLGDVHSREKNIRTQRTRS